MQHSDCNSPLADVLGPFNNTSMLIPRNVSEIFVFTNACSQNMHTFLTIFQRKHVLFYTAKKKRMLISLRLVQ